MYLDYASLSLKFMLITDDLKIDGPGDPEKNVPSFAQVFSRSISRYEGDILQVYWAMSIQFRACVMNFIIIGYYVLTLLVPEHMKEIWLFCLFL